MEKKEVRVKEVVAEAVARQLEVAEAVLAFATEALTSAASL